MPMKAPRGPSQRSQPNSHGSLDRDARRRAEHRVLIFLWRLLEELPTGHRNDGRADPVLRQCLAGGHRDADLGARREQRDLALPVSLGQHIGAARRAVFRIWLAPQQRERLAGQSEQGGSVAPLQCKRPAFGGLDRVGRAVDIKPRHRPQRGQMLYRLMGRAVLAEPDRIVRHHIDNAGPNEGGQPDRGPGVIGKCEERPAIRDQPAMHGDAIHRRRHPVLAHPVSDIAAGIVAPANVLLVLGLGVVRRCEVGGAANQLRNHPGQGIEHRPRGLACRDFRICLPEVMADLRDRLIEARRQLSALASQEFGTALPR